MTTCPVLLHLLRYILTGAPTLDPAIAVADVTIIFHVTQPGLDCSSRHWVISVTSFILQYCGLFKLPSRGYDSLMMNETV